MQQIIGRALERHRSTIGQLRSLSFNLEPVVLRDQGFAPAVRRGPPQTLSVKVNQSEDGGVVTSISDDAPGERRRRTLEEMEERARTLNGDLVVDHRASGGTTVRVLLPPYA